MCAYNMAFGRHASKEGNIMAQQKRNTPLLRKRYDSDS
jgi:hypothetical protein